jgi:hypothetical protein
LPAEFISADGFGITAAARRYLAPLIAGEAYIWAWRDCAFGFSSGVAWSAALV